MRMSFATVWLWTILVQFESFGNGEKLGTELLYAAAAIPPGTASLDSGVIKNVVQAAGVELARVLDEPMAANAILKIKNGASLMSAAERPAYRS